MLIYPLRKGKYLNDAFKIANILLKDDDDLVQKGYGWMLKEASPRFEDKVFEYIMSKKEVMPRTALRYAIEKMSGDRKQVAMAK